MAASIHHRTRKNQSQGCERCVRRNPTTAKVCGKGQQGVTSSSILQNANLPSSPERIYPQVRREFTLQSRIHSQFLRRGGCGHTSRGARPAPGSELHPPRRLLQGANYYEISLRWVWGWIPVEESDLLCRRLPREDAEASARQHPESSFFQGADLPSSPDHHATGGCGHTSRGERPAPPQASPRGRRSAGL